MPPWSRNRDAPRPRRRAVAAGIDPIKSVPPQAAPAAADADEDEIVVTGKPPRGAVVGDIPPENVLRSRDVRATGATNFDELLDALAPQISSARDFSGAPPLVLLNGHKVSSYRELRDIPIDRTGKNEGKRSRASTSFRRRWRSNMATVPTRRS